MYTGPRTALRQPLPGAAAAAAGRPARASRRPVPRRPPHHAAGRPHPADRRGRSQLCRHPGRCRARRGPEGAGHGARRGGARPRAGIQAGRHVARHLPARHAGLERAQPVQAHARDAPHPGADPEHGRGPPAGPGARRLLLPQQADHHRGPERRAVAHQRLREAAQEAAADRRGQRGRALRRQRAAVPSRHRDRHRRHRPRRAGEAARAALRLHGARPAPARHVGLRGAGGDPARRDARRPAGGGVHRPRALGRGGRPAAHHGALDRGQGRGLARAAVRRDRAVPAPGRGRPAGGQEAHAGAPAQLRRDAGRPHRAGGRRRHAQHLRAVERARAARHERADGDHRPRGDLASSRARPRSRSC